GGVAVPGNLTIGNFLGGSGANKGQVVRLLAGQQIGSSATVTINNSGLLDLNGNNNTIGVGQLNALTMTGGTVSTGRATLTLGAHVAGLANVATLTPATINGNLSLGGQTRTFDVQAGVLPGPNTNDMVINALISDGGAAAGLTKTTLGKLQLTANNTYT